VYPDGTEAEGWEAVPTSERARNPPQMTFSVALAVTGAALAAVSVAVFRYGPAPQQKLFPQATSVDAVT
jgi:hypothetical protein